MTFPAPSKLLTHLLRLLAATFLFIGVTACSDDDRGADGNDPIEQPTSTDDTGTEGDADDTGSDTDN